MDAFDEFYAVAIDDAGAEVRFDTRDEVKAWIASAKAVRARAMREMMGLEVPHPSEFIWSIVESDDGNLYAVPGVRAVNVVYYVLATSPVRPEDRDAEFRW